jgi:glycosyltransferase involved in cell wall biosynthesis
MPEISACIISFNEESKIEDCLKSLLPVADEIILVDSGSTDRTIDIARKYTDRISSHPFAGYGKLKNFATGMASHDWILSLDCDERLSPELQQSILAIKDRLNSNNAYSMARRTFYIYRWLNHCWYPDTKTRLFNRTTAQWADSDIHESVTSTDVKVAKLEGDILHYSFDSFSDHLRTIDKFTEISAHELMRKNRKVNIFSPVTHASWTFFRLYFLKRGFLDGFAGFAVAVLSYMHAFIKYSKAYIWQKHGYPGQGKNENS